MATFYANPNDENEIWIERAAFDGYGFRNWHVMFFCFSGFTILVVLICCCVKIRVPRTKQQIEADYRRKKLAQKFQQRLRLIQNQEMDALDLQRALEIIQQDYKEAKDDIVFEIAPTAPPQYCINMGEEGNLERSDAKNFAKRMSTIMKFTTKPSCSKN